MDFQNHVLAELKVIKDDVKNLIGDVAGLKVKAGFWGLLGGMIPVCIGIVIWFIERK